tara:strand:- start:60 stop:236 length:177 start_codon:yes stop_codon:yes gene_type:complete
VGTLQDMQRDIKKWKDERVGQRALVQDIAKWTVVFLPLDILVNSVVTITFNKFPIVFP